MFTHFDRIHEYDGRTDKRADGRTVRHGIGPATLHNVIASRLNKTANEHLYSPRMVAEIKEGKNRNSKRV